MLDPALKEPREKEFDARYISASRLLVPYSFSISGGFLLDREHHTSDSKTRSPSPLLCMNFSSMTYLPSFRNEQFLAHQINAQSLVRLSIKGEGDSTTLSLRARKARRACMQTLPEPPEPPEYIRHLLTDGRPDSRQFPSLTAKHNDAMAFTA